MEDDHNNNKNKMEQRLGLGIGDAMDVDGTEPVCLTNPGGGSSLIVDVFLIRLLAETMIEDKYKTDVSHLIH